MKWTWSADINNIKVHFDAKGSYFENFQGMALRFETSQILVKTLVWLGDFKFPPTILATGKQIENIMVTMCTLCFNDCKKKNRKLDYREYQIKENA